MNLKHYWEIHKKVFNREWGYLDRRTRNRIAADVGHETHEYKSFTAWVKTEAERLFNDPDYYYNDRYRFQYSH